MPGADVGTFEEELQAIRPEILAYAYRLLGSWDDAEDAVQMAEVKAWRARERFRAGDFRPWLFLMTKRACCDVWRDTAFAKRADAARWSEEVSVYFIDPTPTAEERLLSRCVRPELLAAIAALPGERMRRAVVLVYLQGLEVAQAARLLGVTNHAVAMHTWKARQLLRKRLAHYAP